jgi:hypothetical protein
VKSQIILNQKYINFENVAFVELFGATLAILFSLLIGFFAGSVVNFGEDYLGVIAVTILIFLNLKLLFDERGKIFCRSMIEYQKNTGEMIFTVFGNQKILTQNSQEISNKTLVLINSRKLSFFSNEFLYNFFRTRKANWFSYSVIVIFTIPGFEHFISPLEINQIFQSEDPNGDLEYYDQTVARTRAIEVQLGVMDRDNVDKIADQVRHLA